MYDCVMCCRNLGGLGKGGWFVAVHQVAYPVVGLQGCVKGLINAVGTLHTQPPLHVGVLVVCQAAHGKLLSDGAGVCLTGAWRAYLAHDLQRREAHHALLDGA